MRQSLLWVGIFAFLFGCSSAEKEMLNEVADHLKDPDSARFSQIQVKKSEREHRTVLCGVVNAKNGFGGYGEPQRFTAVRVEATKVVSVAFDQSCEVASMNADMNDSLDYAREVLSQHK